MVTTTYKLTVISTAGCEANAVVKIDLQSNIIFIPNTFTPNSDSINDTWNIGYLNEYPKASVDVYNRYGELLFHSVGYQKPWDGTFNNRVIAVGTYYYIIKLNNGTSQSSSGYVTLLR